MLSSALFDRRVPCREPACSERRGARSGSRAAAGLAAIGVRNFIVSDFVTELQPVPAGIPARTIMACLNGAAVLATTASILANYRVRLAALCLTLLLSIWIILLHAPRLAAHPTNGGAWTSALEILAMASAALMLAALSSHDQALSPKWNDRLDGAAPLGLFCFAVTLPIFGLLHFIYYEYVASVIPEWLPGHTFWAYFTGAAHIAAGIAIVTSLVTGYVRLALLAAALFAVMVGILVVILHAPRVAAHLHTRPEWTSLFVALALCGSGPLMLHSLAKEKNR